jgi:hypothetical protein
MAKKTTNVSELKSMSPRARLSPSHSTLVSA